MTSNPMPWIILAGIVAGSLYLKGYFGSFSPTEARHANRKKKAGGKDVERLSNFDARTLGIAWGIALKREADEAIAGNLTQEAAASLTKRFTDPFSHAGNNPEANPPPK